MGETIENVSVVATAHIGVTQGFTLNNPIELTCLMRCTIYNWFVLFASICSAVTSTILKRNKDTIHCCDFRIMQYLINCLNRSLCCLLDLCHKMYRFEKYKVEQTQAEASL